MAHATQKPSPWARVGWILFVLVLGGAMITLTSLLMGASQDGGGAIEAYAASVAAGAPVGVGVAGDEAAALAEALRATRGVSVQNFQAQAGTACFWVELDTATGSTDARFVLADRGETMEVIAASLRRECECPDPDFERRCHLR